MINLAWIHAGNEATDSAEVQPEMATIEIKNFHLTMGSSVFETGVKIEVCNRKKFKQIF